MSTSRFNILSVAAGLLFGFVVILAAWTEFLPAHLLKPADWLYSIADIVGQNAPRLHDEGGVEWAFAALAFGVLFYMALFVTVAWSFRKIAGKRSN